jgi:hypothetical protein
VVVRHLVESAHCSSDFRGVRVNCFSTKQKRRDSLCKASKIFVHAHHALYNRLQICHEYVQLLIVFEVPLQIHIATGFELRTHFQTSSTASKLSWRYSNDNRCAAI